MKQRELAAALDWIRATPEIRDVLLTGGDPLVFSDDRLGWLLAELRAIPHVEIVRLGTRLPGDAAVPRHRRALRACSRATTRSGSTRTSTTRRSSRPRPAEALRRGSRARASRSATRACCCAGINDDVATMQALCEGLVRMRVRPYYCYQAQLLEGTAHFRVPIERRRRALPRAARAHERLRDPAVRARHALRQGAARAIRTCAAARATTWWSRPTTGGSGASRTRGEPA